jgi:CRISPR-associated protein Cas2
MTLFHLEAVPVSLRGELSCWLTPLGPTVFVRRVSSTVRELLWLRCVEKCRNGRVVMAWSTPQYERGFEFRFHGCEGTQVIDLDGMPFPSIRDAAWKEAVERFNLLAEKPVDQ